KAGLRKEMKRQRVTLRLKLRGCPVHAGGLGRVRGDGLKPRHPLLPAGWRMGYVRWLPKCVESGGNGAVDDILADLVAGELVGNGLVEPVTIGNGQRQCGIVHSKRLMVGEPKSAWRASRLRGGKFRAMVVTSVLIRLAPGKPLLAGGFIMPPAVAVDL